MRQWSIEECSAYAKQLRDKSKANTAEHAAQAIEYLLGLVQAEQAQPVAWYDSKSGWADFHFFKPVRKPSAPDAEWLPLYTAPPQRKPLTQQGMTAEIERLKDALNKSESRLHEVAVHCEQVERDRDAALLALRQAEKQEPVAWVEQIIDDLHALHDSEIIREIDSGDALIRLDAAIAAVEEAEQRYTAPPQRPPWVGLTGDELNEFAAGCHLGNSVQGAIRKAEAKLKEKNT